MITSKEWAPTLLPWGRTRLQDILARRKKLLEGGSDYVGRVRIWSAEWKLWWRPNSQGYTSDIREAGIYSIAEALLTAGDCGPEKGIWFENVDSCEYSDNGGGI